jgi:hypothetical protein
MLLLLRFLSRDMRQKTSCGPAQEENGCYEADDCDELFLFGIHVFSSIGIAEIAP